MVDIEWGQAANMASIDSVPTARLWMLKLSAPIHHMLGLLWTRSEKKTTENPEYEFEAVFIRPYSLYNASVVRDGRPVCTGRCAQGM